MNGPPLIVKFVVHCWLNETRKSFNNVTLFGLRVCEIKLENLLVFFVIDTSYLTLMDWCSSRDY